MKKHILLILFAFFVNTVQAADTYGYLGFWHHRTDSSASTHTLTTTENISSAEHAKAQWQQFCSQLSNTQAEHTSVCFGETFLHNQCAAAAYDSAKGLPSPQNIFIVKGKNFAQVQTAAQQKCVQAAGQNAACEVETAFCSDRNLYSE